MNYARLQKVADRLINKYGMKAVLRRTGMADRVCTVVDIDYIPREHMGKMQSPIDRTFLVSAVGLLLGPEMAKDMLVTFQQGVPGLPEDEHLKIIEPPGRLAPGGIVVYWELHVRA